MEKLIYQLFFLQFAVFISLGRTGDSSTSTITNPTTTKTNNQSSETTQKKVTETTTRNNEIGINGSTVNITSSNETETRKQNETSSTDPSLIHVLKSSDAVLRAVYVASGILLIIMIYSFCRLRRNIKKNKWHKYGLLKNSGEVEMMPLGTEEEEDEENTMFDARTFRSDK